MIKLIQADIRLAREHGWSYRRIYKVTERAVAHGKFVTWDWEHVTDPEILAKALRITERLASLEGLR